MKSKEMMHCTPLPNALCSAVVRQCTSMCFWRVALECLKEEDGIFQKSSLLSLVSPKSTISALMPSVSTLDLVCV